MNRIASTEVLPSSEVRKKLPKLMDDLIQDPDLIFQIGRQRRREAVVISASRYDEIIRVNDLARDLAWSEFARDRIENPTSSPVSWEEAQRRRT